MRHFWVFLAFFLNVGNILFGQATGLLVSNERYERVQLLPTYSGTKYTEVPVKVNLKKYCPVPGDQQKTGACVGWAVGYGALTIQRAIQSNITDQASITQQANSAAFLYNQVRRGYADCMEGAFLEDALELVKAKGDCLERSFSFREVDCSTKPGAPLFVEASQYKVSDYAAVFGLDEDAKSKIGKSCKILATNTPLIVGMGVTESFFEILPGASMWDPAETETINSYHAMVMVGYNNVERYFEFMNSFGASWGQNGFIKIKYEDFERLCRYAYVVLPEQQKEFSIEKTTVPTNIAREPFLLSGSFAFRQPAGFVTNQSGEELMYFEEVKAIQTNLGTGFYITEHGSFEVGDVFQLVARDVPKGCYLYVFSQSADGSVQKHFPRQKNGLITAGFVLEKTVEVIIPGEEMVLQLPMPGEDYLCILYSRQPIADFETRLNQLTQDQRAFREKFESVFSELLIPAQQIQFSSDKMAFSAMAYTDQKAVAVPIVLRVLAK